MRGIRLKSGLFKVKYLLAALVFGAVAFLYWHFSEKSSKPGEEPYDYVEARLRESLEALDAQLLLAGKTEGEGPVTGGYPVLEYANRQLVSWSSNAFVPDYRMIDGDYPVKLAEWEDNKFILLKHTSEAGGAKREYVGILPLYRNFRIENDVIGGGYNQELFGGLQVSVFTEEKEGRRAFSFHGTPVCFFTIYSPAEVRSGSSGWLVFVLFTCSIICLFLFFRHMATLLLASGWHYTSMVVLLLGLVFLRGLLLVADFPNSVFPIGIFNPRYLVISEFHRSLGDIIITCFFLAYYLYVVFNTLFRKEAHFKFSNATGWIKWVVTVIVMALGYATLIYTGWLMQEIFKNSQIHLDMSRSIHLDVFRIGTLLIFFLMFLSYFFISHASYILIRHYRNVSPDRAWAVHLVIGGIAVLLMALIHLPMVFMPLLHVLYFSIIFRFRLPEFIRPLQFQTFLYFFLAAAAASILGSYAIYRHDEFRRNVQKQKFANNLLIENDIQGEFQLDGIMKGIRSDIFILTRMMSRILAKNLIEQRIRRLYLTGYFDKYDVQISLYDAGGSLFNSTGTTYQEIRKTYDGEIYRTDYPDIFFESNFSPGSTKRYICLIDLERYGISIGHIVLRLRLKKYLPSTVYPRLLVDRRFMGEPADENYSYGIYEGDNLRYKSGTFNYVTYLPAGIFENERLYTSGVVHSGYHHLGIRGNNAKRIIITSPLYKPVWMVSNFSFLFLALVGGIALMVMINALEIRLTNASLTLASKIQVYLSIAFFLPLVAVTIATLSAINTSYSEDVDRQYMKKAESVNGYLVSLMDNYLSNKINREVLSNELTDIARFSQADINLFSVGGKLVASSQPAIYEDKLISEYINPGALAKIRNEDSERIIFSEALGNLSYKSVYLAIKSFNDASLLGIMSMPFFESGSRQKRQQTEVFTNIINIFTFIFILSIVISFMASRVLTNPLRIITQRLRKTTFGETNEPIQWNSADEDWPAGERIQLDAGEAGEEQSGPCKKREGGSLEGSGPAGSP